MNRSNKKNILEKFEISTLLSSYDRFCRYVCEQGPYMSFYIILLVVSMFCFRFSDRKKMPTHFATISCHTQSFFPIKSAQQQVLLRCDSLLTSEPVVKCLASTSALKKKDPCSISSSKLKGAQQPPPKRIFVMTQTKPSLKIASAQMHTSTNQIIPRVLGDLSSLGHIHINRKTKNKWKKKSKKWIHKPETGFPVGKRITLEKTNRTKRLLAPKCQTFPNGSDLDGGLTFSEKVFKYTFENNFNLTYGTMKIQIIEDPSLVMTLYRAHKRLTDISLSHLDQLKTLHFTLTTTCDYSTVTSTSMFTAEDRNLLSQETYGLYLLLTHPFELNDSFMNRARHSFCSSLVWPKPPYPWPQLKQKSFDLLKSDLALELVDLDRDFSRVKIYYPLALRVRSLAPKYFERRVLESFTLIKEGMNLAKKQSKVADKYAIVISAIDKLNNIRSQTLVSEFDKECPNQKPYGELFYSATGKQRIVSDREPFDLSSLVVKNKFFGSTGEYRFFDIFGI